MLGKIVVMDVGESPVERPKKAAVLLLRQKKKHTLKIQLIITHPGKIICVV
ncbi:MAG: hypothetical protein M3342_14600 [Bacteroidota bacterium]|nr:hypothetical protein [Bacteroidota bacterium]